MRTATHELHGHESSAKGSGDGDAARATCVGRRREGTDHRAAATRTDCQVDAGQRGEPGRPSSASASPTSSQFRAWVALQILTSGAPRSPVRQSGASRRPPRAFAPRAPWRAAPRRPTAPPKRRPYGPESRSGRISPKSRKFSFEGGAARQDWATVRSSAPLQFMIFLVASWLARQQGEAIEYLRAENRVLRGRLSPKRLRFTDAERCLLAEKGRARKEPLSFEE